MVVFKLIFITFIAIVAIVILVLALGGFLISRAAGRATRMIGGIVRGTPSQYRYAGVSPAMLRCPQARCHAENQPGARFCRRCGVAMNGQPVAAQRVNVQRRAAMW